jgi:hypothetical protein
MKAALAKGFILSGLMMGIVTVSQAARVHAWISINPFPIVVAPAPAVVVEQRPVVVEDTYAPPPQDYGRVLSDFHNRVRRLQRLLDHQLNRGIITQGQYDRHADDLDRIMQDERQDAARHNGALTPREVNDLHHRLLDLQDRIHDDISR